MEEINIQELLKYFVSKIYIVIITTIIFLIGGLVYINAILTPMYHSSTTLILVSDNKSENSQTLQSDVALNKNLVTTYSEIVKSRTVLSKVISELKLDSSVSSLSKNINVTSIENTEIIKIEVSDEDSKEAQKIANTISKVFINEVKKIYNLTNVSVVDKAVVEKSAYNVQPVKQSLIAAVLGIIAGSGIIFIIFYFDTSVKSATDIEEKLGLSVIGNITLVDEKKDKRG